MIILPETENQNRAELFTAPMPYNPSTVLTCRCVNAQKWMQDPCRVELLLSSDSGATFWAATSYTFRMHQPEDEVKFQLRTFNTKSVTDPLEHFEADGNTPRRIRSTMGHGRVFRSPWTTWAALVRWKPGGSSTTARTAVRLFCQW